jgi:hypothetical protein
VLRASLLPSPIVVACGAACLAPFALSVVTALGQSRQVSRAQSRDHDGRGALAVLRRDGLLVPFASFNRDSWRVTWPLRVTPATPVPLTREGIPESWWGTRTPNQWRAYLPDGTETFPELGAPSVFGTFCEPRLGIRTAYRSAQPLPPMPIDPFPKDGLAISGGVPLEEIEVVKGTSAEWPALTAELVTPFNRVEDKTIGEVRSFRQWKHPRPEAERHALPIRLESWYRAPGDEPGTSVSYVEMARQYSPGPDDQGCGLETIVSGWLYHRDGKLTKASNLRGKLAYCDRVGVTYMLPFGRIRPNKTTYWVFQLSGWESEWYEVVAVRRDSIRYALEVGVGAMRACRDRR